MKRKTKRVLLFFAVFLVLLAFSLLAFRKPLMRRYYVRDYESYTAAYAEEYQVPESLLCAVIFCESRFRPQVKSSRGACGLMQLAPATFAEVLWRLGISEEIAVQADIFDPEWNIRCGAYYLHYLYGLFGDWETSLAAYNAGMGNVNQWLADTRYSDDGKTLKQIPFSETEAYVKKVQKSRERYQELYQETISGKEVKSET